MRHDGAKALKWDTDSPLDQEAARRRGDQSFIYLLPVRREVIGTTYFGALRRRVCCSPRDILTTNIIIVPSIAWFTGDMFLRRFEDTTCTMGISVLHAPQ